MGKKWNSNKQGILIGWAVVTGTLVLCTVFAMNRSLADGLVMGKVFWFHLSMLGMALPLGIAGGRQQEENFSITWPDVLACAFYGITLMTYNWSLNPEPEKLLFGGQLLVLWWTLRFLLKSYPGLKFYFLLVLILIGITEAVWGLQQMRGYSVSNHPLFKLTGSFFNPGPYSGYLAIILPLCLWVVLRFNKLLHGIAWIAISVIVLVLPAGMSRSAWIAAIIACGWVYWVERINREKSKAIYKKYRKFLIPLSILFLLACGWIFSEVYALKRDSADGRLLMWKVTGKAILHQPITGTGLGGFPAAYAEEQARYFQAEAATDTEKRVAGCPEYAFNEYLQIGLEQGIFGLVLFISWIVSLFICGTRNQQQGAVGGIIALAIFALSAYPLQLPSFWILFIFLGTICTSGTQTSAIISIRQKGFIRGGRLLIAIMGLLLFIRQADTYKAYSQWYQLQILYRNKAYRSVVEDYLSLQTKLGHKPKFLFEEALCLNNTGQYDTAIQVLEQAKQLSGDPMIRYMIAKNKQALGKFAEAEQELRQAILILPERVYPYYLLAKLYAEPAFYHPDKLKVAAQEVLTKEPKVQSTAIREMREEIINLIENNEASES